MRRRPGIGRRLTGISVAVTAAALIAAGVVLLQLHVQAVRQGRTRDLEILANAIGRTCTAMLQFDDQEAATQALQALGAEPDVVAAAIYSGGRPFAAWQVPGAHVWGPATEPGSDGGMLRVRAPILAGEQELGRIEVVAHLMSFGDAARTFAWQGALVLSLSLLLAYALARRLQRWVSGPLSDLAGTARAVAQGRDFSLRAAVAADHEIGDLVRAFNGMLDEIERRGKRLAGHAEELEQQVARRTEELREARDRAEAAVRAKTAFLANMSHEIRTPLNAVLGMTGLVLDTELSSLQREYLTTVDRAGVALLRIIDDILDWSKMEAGALQFELVPTDLRRLLGECLRPLAVSATAKGLELLLTVATDVPGTMACDPLRLRQIVTNLVGNAIKFTARGEVAVAVAWGSSQGEVRTIRITVRDTGIGIAADQLPRLFASFSQADSSTTRRFGGSGLGLAISRRIAELMGGRIWVESEVGVGSSFHCEVPARVLAEPVRQLGGVSAVVVDPHASAARATAAVLRDLGAEVVECVDWAAGERCLSQAARLGRPADLVLLAARRPGHDGVELARQVVGQLAGPVLVLMTTHLDLPQVSEVAGICHVQRPVLHEELLAVWQRRAASREVPATASPTVPATPGPAERRLRVLVAEDNPVNQRLVRGLLERDGHTCEVVPDGKACLEELARGAYDVILMDVQMPVMDGLEATRRIRLGQAGDDPRIPIIALTANAFAEDEARCREAGVDEYLAKPFRAAQLSELLRRVTDAAMATWGQSGG